MNSHNLLSQEIFFRESTAILLATHNGEKFLEPQLLSLVNQTFKNFDLWIIDDGSKDSTVRILEKFRHQFQGEYFVQTRSKPQGPMASFSDLLNQSFDSKAKFYKYFLFCDQDDIWDPNKIEISISRLKNAVGPTLFHSDLRLIDSNDEVIGPSFQGKLGFSKFSGPDFFWDLMAQNVVTGCTVAFNRELAKLAVPISKKAIMHDHWVGLIAGFFGNVLHESRPLLSYRQHSANATGGIGSSSFFKKIKKNFKKIILAKWEQNFEFLKHIRTLEVEQTTQIRQKIQNLNNYFQDLFDSRLKFLVLVFRSPMRAQGCFRTLVFFMGTFIWWKKIRRQFL